MHAEGGGGGGGGVGETNREGDAECEFDDGCIISDDSFVGCDGCGGAGRRLFDVG